MKTKIEQIKTKVKDHKELIIGIGLGLVVGAASVYLFKRDSSQSLVIETAETVNQAGRDINNIAVTVNEEPVKRLSYIIRWGDKTFDTQRDAAEALGVSEIHLSQFLNGKKKDLGVDLDAVPVRLGVRNES